MRLTPFSVGLAAIAVFVPQTEAQKIENPSVPKTAITAVEQFEAKQDLLSRQMSASIAHFNTIASQKSHENKTELLAELDNALAAASKSTNPEEADKIKAVIETYKKSESDDFLAVSKDKKYQAEAEKATSQMTPSLESLTGTWSGKWGTTGASLHLNIQSTRDLENGKITIHDGKTIYDASHEFMELIPYRSGILVLGYTKSDGRHPDKTLPNHVGFVTKKQD